MADVAALRLIILDNDDWNNVLLAKAVPVNEVLNVGFIAVATIFWLAVVELEES